MAKLYRLPEKKKLIADGIQEYEDQKNAPRLNIHISIDSPIIKPARIDRLQPWIWLGGFLLFCTVLGWLLGIIQKGWR